MSTPPVRVRFAPSPTGNLHVGGARTALYNWLFARHVGGAFVLRIEDTDRARNRPEYLEGIFDALHWLGLDWDEGPRVGGAQGPYEQSARGQLYREAVERLRASGALFECYCAARDDHAAADGGDEEAPQSEAHCRCAELTDAQREQRRAHAAPALRFRVDPQRAVVIDDIVRGSVTFPAGSIGDFVVVKSNGDPLYNFCAAVDDNAMAISHVIRGEEHLANTPKQLLLYEAFGWQPPAFAHIPIILNEQRRKLSKRDGATFVSDFRTLGYLPQALVNFLALLGWSPGGNREMLTLDEMIDEFELETVVKHPAIFDVAKLTWMNKEYLKRLPTSELVELTLATLRERGAEALPSREYVERVCALLHDRVRTVAEVVDLGAYFFNAGPVPIADDAFAKHASAPDTAQRLSDVRSALAALDDFSPAGVEAAIRECANARGVKAAALIHPLRVALTGQAVSPGIFEVCSIIGKQRALARIDDLMSRVSAQRAEVQA